MSHLIPYEVELLERVKSDYFLNNQVHVDIKVEGQSLNDNKQFVLGCRAGPSVEISNLFHEMGHFAEREIPKLLKRPLGSWGYKFGKPWSCLGRSGFEPNTAQSVYREFRIWAFQVNLEHHYGLETDIEDLIDSAVYLPAFYLYKMEIKSEKEKLAIACEEVKLLSKTDFTLKVFNEAWLVRLDLLKKQEDQLLKRKKKCCQKMLCS